ncbi:MAG TPA: hypothetical protein VFP70_15225 [Burkholderiales bacterium]|nr:hypothetical protein [Burkholderiales bacterium]
MIENLRWSSEGACRKDSRTVTSQKAPLSDLAILPGFPELAAMLAANGFAFLPDDSVARIHRTCTSTRAGGLETLEYSGYWLFASLQFRWASGGEELLLHLPARGGSAPSIEALLESIRFPDEFGSTLTVIANPSPSGADARRQCLIMAVNAFSRTYPISRFYQRIAVPYIERGDKANPDGRDALFAIRASQLESDPQS